MAWLRVLLRAAAAICAFARLAVARRERVAGRLEAENRQLEKDNELLRKAADARRRVDDDFERVRRDPRNRDAGE